MTRRDVMALASVLPAWTAAAQAGYQPKFFSPAEFALLESFTEILIPTDETPGAREARVAQYIDFAVDAAAEYASEMQRDWRKAIDWLMGQKVDAALAERMEASPQHPDFKNYRLIKQMTVFAFYTSEAGLIQNLEYKGNAYLTDFPACTHPEHRKV
jgi:hypothetical protein